MQELLLIAADLQQATVNIVPRFLTAVAVVVVLLVAAKTIERLLAAFLRRVRLDDRLAEGGMDRTLQRLGIESISQLLPRLVYYLLLFLFARTAADAYGLTAISEAISALFGYLPNVGAALILVVAGTALSQFVGDAVTRAAEESGVEFARSLGTVVSGAIVFIVGVMAIGQLRFETEMVRIVTVCVLSGAGLAFGLSVGLGSRDVTRNVLAGYYARQLFRPGDPLEVRGERGVLRAITATQTVIEQGAGLVIVANSALLDETVKR